MRITTFAALTAVAAGAALALPVGAHAADDGVGRIRLCINGPAGLAAEVFASGDNYGGGSSGFNDGALIEKGGVNVRSGLLTVVTANNEVCAADVVVPAGGYLASQVRNANAVYPNVPCNAGLPCPAKLLGWQIQTNNIGGGAPGVGGSGVQIYGSTAHVNVADEANANTNEGLTVVTAVFGYDPAAD